VLPKDAGMNRGTAHPYFHPTTVVLVDDNEDFLVNFSLNLNEDIAYRLFSSPNTAIQHINGSHNHSSNTRCLSSRLGLDSSSNVESLIVLNVDEIKNELLNNHRFDEVSVIIIDYDMPGINGLELCRLIRNPNIKKILLTGVGDEKLAVKAFNDGIIDKFILKNDNESVQAINDYINEFQQHYFNNKCSFIKNALCLKTYGFLIDPAFLSLFQRLRKQNDTTEYYLTHQPSGYIMATAQHELTHLVVFSENELATQLEIIKELDGPEDLQSLIRNREVIPHFDTSDGYYSKDIADWKNQVYPCAQMENGAPYYYSIIENPNHDFNQAQPLKYDDFLANLDELLNAG
jgi:CheY-like chemotaxis protein